MDGHTGEVVPAPQGQESNMKEPKVPPLEEQTNVQTRFSQVEASQSVIVDEQQKLLSSRNRRKLMEVFSVKFLGNRDDLEDMYGCILISSCPTYVVFSRKEGAPLNITQEGFLKLRGPNEAIEPWDQVLVCPRLFKYKAYDEAHSDEFAWYEEEDLWTYSTFYREFYDRLLSKIARSRFGPIEVNYAVYFNGVEARVDVSMTLVDYQLPSAVIYGSITAHNSKLGDQARSSLFNRDKAEGIRVDASTCEGNGTQLPLLKSKTVHPIDSIVTITVNMWESNIMGTQDQQIAENMIFEFTNLRGRDVRTFNGNACQVSVGVVWAEA